MANVLGCGVAKLPLKYLGVPVGCNMARCSNWDAIVHNFYSKLTQWNARLLSVGGRLSLIKASTDLWVTVIKEIHGHHGGIFDLPLYSSCFSPWSGILSLVKSLNKKGIDLLSLCTRKLENGASIRFWDDVWCGNQPLKVQFGKKETVEFSEMKDAIGILFLGKSMIRSEADY
ncbi:hypothetical protein CTI12_AA065350 [Artemisia annua]|uniref:RNA-directed DNA polymerase, eukaryota, Reverse transcriptase zinc-binding domain protein n=1 Tax=Artemisia annua TaxID=35608 RepID=A0A2U1Q793_ARTAN|nr:hypothetical protein CTI12_AA065350 [Artemisia annua]